MKKNVFFAMLFFTASTSFSIDLFEVDDAGRKMIAGIKIVSPKKLDIIAFASKCVRMSFVFISSGHGYDKKTNHCL